MKKEDFERILKYREELKKKIEYYKEILKCKHEYGNIAITKNVWSEVTCLKCGEGFAITQFGDGSVMSSKHIEEENKRIKSSEDILFFRKRLNEVIQKKILSIELALKEMRIFILKRHLFKKSELTILRFEGNGIIGYDYHKSTLIIDNGYENPNNYYFYDGNFKIRRAIITTYKPDEWMDANRTLRELK